MGRSAEAVFRQCYRPLCLYALHYLHSVEEAEDVVQDCFVRMMEHGLPAQPRAYLYTAVRNACVDLLRRRNPFVTDVRPADLQDFITDEEAVDRSEREARLWTAIERLPERCREIFLMSKRDGLTYRQIADRLELSPKTVEHQVAKALHTLRGQRDELLSFMLSMVA